jgi:hypothetical protein
MKYIYLAKEYDLVVNDTFELFYRGVICLYNPYQYYILVRCQKGNPYPRYYTFTPKKEDVGDYSLTISLLDIHNQVIEEASTILHVYEAVPPQTPLNVLCIGDSLTFNGVWPKEGYRRFTKVEGEPAGLGFNGTIKMLGSCHQTVEDEEIGYEGYGSWTWKSFCTTDVVSTKSPIWVNVEHHELDENDQHSTWKSGNLEWILESIEEKRLKFKRGNNNYSPNPKIEKTFENVMGGIHTNPIEVIGYEFEIGNPFWNKEINKIDFKNYCQKHHYETIDFVYILLTWNGLYKPYHTDFQYHIDYAKQLIRQIHIDYPQAHVTLLGIQICSVNGGIASNYGASGPYSDLLGTITTAFHYNESLENLVKEEEFKSYCRYVDTKAQFDSEYNMPMVERKVNVRNNTTEMIGTNGVHPTMNGYLQLGDVFFRSLVRDVIEKNK